MFTEERGVIFIYGGSFCRDVFPPVLTIEMGSFVECYCQSERRKESKYRLNADFWAGSEVERTISDLDLWPEMQLVSSLCGQLAGTHIHKDTHTPSPIIL